PRATDSTPGTHWTRKRASLSLFQTSAGACGKSLLPSKRNMRQAPLQRLQFNVAEIDFGAFGLKEYLALGLLRLGAFVLRLAVDDQVDRVALAGDVVLVPFADRLFHAVLQMKVMPRGLRVLSCRIDGKLDAVRRPYASRPAP